MKNLTFCCLIVGLLFLTTTNILAEESEISRMVPLLRKIQITPPSPDLLKEVAAFSGRWEGYWDVGNLPTVLIVEKIELKQAEIIHASGKSSRGEAGYRRQKVEVTTEPNPEIKFTLILPGHGGFTLNCNFRYKMNEDLKTLTGIRECERLGTANVRMKKVE